MKIVEKVIKDDVKFINDTVLININYIKNLNDVKKIKIPKSFGFKK